MPLGRLLSRVKFDYYLLALLATVAVAAVLPARGAAEPIAKYAVYAAVFLLFFLYGARLSTQAVVAGHRALAAAEPRAALDLRAVPAPRPRPPSRCSARGCRPSSAPG